MFRRPTRLLFACTLTTLAACATAPEPLKPSNESPFIFEASDGQQTEALRGHLMVPERRSDPGSRQIRLEYVRFPATGQSGGPPIIYLAGGPGGSGIGTAKGPRFALFMAMREFGDVIALDQRGTGASNDMPTCNSSQADPDREPLSDADFLERHRLAADECLAFWKESGVDIMGYTTLESARDLEALRLHLGARKISLWGISYGSHLSLAAIREMEGRIDRVVLASVEGLDQTVKYPARTDAYFARLQAAIDADEALARQLPDIAGLMRRVHAKLDANPVMLSVPLSDGTSAPFLLERRDLQLLTSGMIADPEWAIMAMQLYAELDQGGVSGVTSVMARFIEPDAPIRFQPMPFAMDIASGTGEARKAEVAAQARTSLLGDYLNFPMPHLDGHVARLDLGDAFREPPESDVPTLVLSGTLDGRTYPESQREAVAGLTNATIVTVENAGHNLFMLSPEITSLILAFMRGQRLDQDTVRVSIPDRDTE